MTDTDVFKHSTPELYDRYMAPLLFEPFARVVADRVATQQPVRILETAAGTGVLTRFAADAAPQAEIVATDINPGVVAYAAKKFDTSRISVQQCDAQDLPFDDASFDLVLCQFGAMFFPDKVMAHKEASRVLRDGGSYLVVTFADLVHNPVPKAADEAVAAMFPNDPPRYMERGPFSYTDASAVEADLRSGGFGDVQVDTTTLTTHVNARDAAAGMVLGSPFRAEIERREPASLERAVDAVTAALQPLDGQEAPVSAHIVTAHR
jgi:ubiquinone/menaquinone biosynthesis C-methylase UbiE